ncbi:hypothetical protein TRFO_32768 [Tritrichomonas foetus]|uniref:HECT-type E3 ubiquitin transferase n=1 Tax=Tritrichomonas foetus TaxID=1144522 RepID=A0A1J4JSK2_9EUKA|nr:hypothetical protein TRFO_32768 [Tritrichomonas foetus]|eukprot:OHT00500.1 hypothetical protein TRFO_32768 [Tritrichomonas foetus]
MNILIRHKKFFNQKILVENFSLKFSRKAGMSMKSTFSSDTSSQTHNQQLSSHFRKECLRIESQSLNDSDLLFIFRYAVNSLSLEMDEIAIFDLANLFSVMWNYNIELISQNLNSLIDISKSSVTALIVTSSFFSTCVLATSTPEFCEKFVDDCFSELINNYDKFKDETCDSFLIFNHVFNRKFIYLFIESILCCLPFSIKYSSDFIPLVFSDQQIGCHNELCEFYITNGYIDILPRKIFTSLLYLELASPYILLSILQNITDEELSTVYQSIFTRVVSLHDSKLAHLLICKFAQLPNDCAHNFLNQLDDKLATHPVKKIQILLDIACNEDFPSEILLYLYKFKIVLPMELSRKITSLPENQECLFVMSANPLAFIDNDVINEVLHNTENLDLFLKLFRNPQTNSSHPIFSDVKFWSHIIKLLNDSLNKSAINVFIGHNPATVSERLIQLFKYNFPQNMNDKFFHFAYKVLKLCGNTLFSAFSGREELKEIISKIQGFISYRFFRLLTTIKPFVPFFTIIPSNYSMMCGMAYINLNSKKQNNVNPPINLEILFKHFTIEDQTEESLQEIANFIIEKKSNYFEYEHLSSKALSFVTVAHLFASNAINSFSEININSFFPVNLICPFCTIVNSDFSRFSPSKMPYLENSINPSIRNFYNNENMTKMLCTFLNEFTPNETHNSFFGSFINSISTFFNIILSMKSCLLDILTIFQKNPIFFDVDAPYSQSVAKFVKKLTFDAEKAEENKFVPILNKITELTHYFVQLIFKYPAPFSTQHLNTTAIHDLISHQLGLGNITLELIDFFVYSNIYPIVSSIPNFSEYIAKIGMSVADQENRDDLLSNVMTFGEKSKALKYYLPFLELDISPRYKSVILLSLDNSIRNIVSINTFINFINSLAFPVDINLFNIVNIIQNFLFDSPTVINYNLVYFERFENNLILKNKCFHKKVEYYVNENRYSLNECFRLWEINGKNCIIAKPEKAILYKNSEYSQGFINTLLDNTRTKPTRQLFCTLISIIPHFPFLLNEYEHIDELFLECFDLFTFYDEYYQKTFVDDADQTCSDNFQLAYAAAHFLSSFVSITKVADRFFHWAFPRLNSFSPGQMFVFISILIPFITKITAQHVIISFMMRYSWVSMLPLYIETQKKFGNKISDYNVIHLLRITSKFFFVYINRMQPESVSTCDELTLLQNPFEVSFNHNVLIPILPIMNNSYTTIFHFSMDESVFITSNFFKNDILHSFEKEKRFFDFGLFVNKPAKLNLSGFPDINPESFNFLSEQVQSLLLLKSIKKIETLTPRMHRYLLSKPNWVFHYLTKPPHFLLTPAHYVILNQVVKELEEIKDQDDISIEIFLSHIYCIDTIFTIFYNPTGCLQNKNTVKESCDLFKEYTINNEYALKRTLQVISREISTQSPYYINELLLLVFSLMHAKNFKKLFVENCADKIIRIVGSPLFLKTIKLALITISIFVKIDYVTDEVLQLMRFALKSSEPAYIQITLELAYHLNEQNKAKLHNDILFLLDKSINNSEHNLTQYDYATSLPPLFDIDIGDAEDYDFISSMIRLNKSGKTNVLSVIFKRFPNIAKYRTNKLLSLLKAQLNLPKKNLTYIGDIIDVLCPKRKDKYSASASPETTNEPLTGIQDRIVNETVDRDANRTSELHNEQNDTVADRSNKTIVETDMNKKTNIPNHIFSKAPEFWQIISDHLSWFQNEINKNPALLQKEFVFLTNYLELLSFMQKSTYFRTQQRKKLRREIVHLHIRRSFILRDSFLHLRFTSSDRILSQFRIRFTNESGADLGGLKKDWFTSLVKELFDPNYALFMPSENGRSYQPNPSSNVNQDHIDYFTFAGQIIARAMIEGVCVDAHLTTSFIKQILGCPVCLRDLEDIDIQLYNSLVWILENPVNSLDMRFTTDYKDIDVLKTVDLVKGGSEIVVTDDNKEEFVRLMFEYRMKGQISEQINAFLKGFYLLIPKEEIQIFTPNELDLLICGVPEIDVNDLRENCDFSRPYHKEHHVIDMFFNVISKWGHEDLAKLLLFITGSSQVPVGGFKMLKESKQPIIIAPGGNNGRLPQAHTCMNILDLPEYQNEDELREKLLFSINECNSFGFA